MRDTHRESERNTNTDAISTAAGLSSVEIDPADAFDRAWARALANEAYAIVQSDLAARGRSGDDAIFRMHVVDGLTYAQIAAASGLTETECLNTTRRVSSALRAAGRELLREEGVPESELDAAIDEVLAIMERRDE
jgi:DNA-directed RNA polymerase specialized sigma24 family protein